MADLLRRLGERAVVAGGSLAGLLSARVLADYFDDDTGRFYESSANSLKEAGITHGCSEQSYCGENPVTRAEIAAFLARALSL